MGGSPLQAPSTNQAPNSCTSSNLPKEIPPWTQGSLIPYLGSSLRWKADNGALEARSWTDNQLELGALRDPTVGGALGP